MSRRSIQSLSCVVGVGLCSVAHCMVATENWTSPKTTYELHALSADRFSLGKGPRFPSVGEARFTVQPGDQVQNWTGERSEVVLGGGSTDFRVTGSEGTEFYRVSVRLATDWKPPESNRRGHKWGIFFQLHGPNEYAAPPAIAFSAEDKFCLALLGGDLATRKIEHHCLKNSNPSFGNWVDFILKVHWSNDIDGSVVVYRRDVGHHVWNEVLTLTSVPTLQYRGIRALHTHYWKAGFYRSESSHVNTLWLGPIVRGKFFEQVSY